MNRKKRSNATQSNTQYNNYGGQVAAFGEGATAENVNMTTNSPDLNELAEKLAALQVKLGAQADSSEHVEEIKAVADAKEAASSGDQSKAMKYLKGAGSWTLKLAEGIGSKVLTDVLEHSIGLK